MKSFRIFSVNTSFAKGTTKTPVASITLQSDLGVAGDAHAGPGRRQVSLLAHEDIEMMKSRGADVAAGSFAENITTTGIDLPSLPIGTRLTIGNVVLEISQIGKQCHSGCAIMEKAGDCIMPRRGVFATVVKEGEIRNGDTGTYHI